MTEYVLPRLAAGFALLGCGLLVGAVIEICRIVVAQYRAAAPEGGSKDVSKL